MGLARCASGGGAPNPPPPLRPGAPLVPIFDVSSREELERYIVRLDIQIRVARFRT
jgi:hypothetical protein